MICCKGLLLRSPRLFLTVWLCSLALPLLAGDPVRVTHDGARKLAPVFLNKGTEIIYAVHDEPTRVSLMRFSLTDGHQERLDSSNPAHQFDADVTADGRYLCFVLTYTSPQSILVIRNLEDGTEARFIPREPRGTVRGPKISPDQKQVVFTLSDPGGQQIAAVDLQGKNLRTLTDSSAIHAWPAISPDSRQIAFGSSQEGNFDLYVMHSDGSQVRRLTDHPQRDMRPAWSPDGKRIAFSSARDGNLEIYVIRSDGSKLQRITNHPDRDDFPVWHPNGDRLLIVSERDGDSDLYLVGVD